MTVNKKARRAARDLFLFCRANGAFDNERARQVARTLASSHRRGALPVLSHFHRLVRLDRERHSARVESAVPLGRSAQERIQSALVSMYGPTLETSFAQNAALIGGMRITVGSNVYEDSVRRRLAALFARL